MIWKDLAIWKKMLVSFGLLVILLIITCVISYYGITKLEEKAEESFYVSSLHDTFSQKITDHYIWLNKLNQSLLDPDSTSVNVETDNTRCNLGKWLYSDERKKCETFYPPLMSKIKELESVHESLHSTAVSINRQLALSTSEGRTNALSIYRSETLKTISDIRNKMMSIFDDLDNSEETVKQNVTKVSSATRIKIVIFSIISVAIAICFSFMIGSYFISRITLLKEFTQSLSKGNFTAALDINQKDEIGNLAEALKTSAIKLGDKFAHMIGEVISLSSSSDSLFGVSEQLADGAASMSDRSKTVSEGASAMSDNLNSVAAASEEASTNVNMVAAAAEEMSATVTTISGNTEKARGITTEAVSKAKDASSKVSELGIAAEEISKVTEVITEISEQTNLLALNATIEAARAGEAGKGFAVVANEIKELARQTAEATQDIKLKIEGIQQTTTDTVSEITQISEVINDVNSIVLSIATSVDEQAITTSEIAENVSQASIGIQEVNENVASISTTSGEIASEIASVSNVAENINLNSHNVKDSAAELRSFANQIKSMMGEFKINDSSEMESDISNSTDQKIPLLFVWNSTFETGISIFDNQHKKLVDMINDLHRAMKLRKGKKITENILTQLVDYTIMHFKAEENMMDKHGYGGVVEQKQQHKDLVAQVEEFSRKFQEGNSMLSMDLMEFLKKWLIDHIKGTDMKYAPFFKDKGVT